jgi:hypothetical protein
LPQPATSEEKRALLSALGLVAEKLFGDRPSGTLRETILHLITETACHAGHLDAVRELIDGRTWPVLTG